LVGANWRFAVICIAGDHEEGLIHALAGEVKGRRTAAVVVANHLSQIRQAIASEMG
jgi:hypothetical protein